jgi:hypothetical protein
MILKSAAMGEGEEEEDYGALIGHGDLAKSPAAFIVR